MSTNKSVDDGFQDCIEDIDHNNSYVKTKVINDGSEPIPVTLDLTVGVTTNIFDQVTAVATSTQTTILSYTVPASKQFKLQLVEASGENIATYEIYRDTTLEAKRRTYWGAGLDIVLQFIQTNSAGLVFTAGEKIEIKVEHERPMSGDFDARILGVLEDV